MSSSFSIKRKLFDILFKFSLKRSKLILTTTSFVASEILINYQIDPRKIKIIGAGPGNISKKRKETDILEQLDLQPNTYFLNINTLNPRKNISTLITEFVRFLKLYPQEDYKLVIVGKRGWDYEQIFDQYALLADRNPNLGLGEKIIFTGYLDSDAVNELIENSTALAYPSIYEGFGMPPLESLLKGKEVILNDISVFRENFGDIPHYFSDNKGSLAMIMKSVAKGEKNNSAKVVQNLEARYNWQRVAKNLLDLTIKNK
jgi:glycosyltransferase involved in cell wall biosynthesis